jgi:hypothetical protein
MRDAGALTWVAAALAVALPCLAAQAGQRGASLAVSVQVVDSCTSVTGAMGLSAQSCSGQSQPVSVVGSDAAGPPAAPAGNGPVLRTAEGSLVTVTY